MAFEGLRDQLKENWADLSAKVQENSLFNTIREKYESQTPSVQKGVIALSIFFAVMIMLSFPYGYYSASNEYLATAEENRELIQGLLKAARSAKTPAPLPPPMDPAMIRSRLQAVSTGNRLLPEQVGEMQDIPAGQTRDLIPAVVDQNGVAVQWKKLNLTQIVQLTNQIQNMGSGIKVLGVDIVQSAGQTHYYDLVVHVMHLGLKPAVAAEDDAPSTRNRPGGRRNSRPTQKQENEE